MSQDGPDTRTVMVARLFEFLREVQRLRTKSIHSLSEYTSSGGTLIDLETVPTDFGVDLSGLQAADPDLPFLKVPRVNLGLPPQPSTELLPWLSGEYQSSSEDPQLSQVLATIPVDDAGLGPLEFGEDKLDEHPEIVRQYDMWRSEWDEWALRDMVSRPTRDLYQRLYIAKETIAAGSQDWELVLGVGRLKWNAADRHVLVQPVHIEMNDVSGELAVIRDGPMALEEDMLSPEQAPSVEVSATLALDLDDLYDQEWLVERLRTYVHRLEASGSFGERPIAADAPWMRLGPMIVLRQRSRMGLVNALNEIAQFMAEADEVPEGLMPLVDPDGGPSQNDLGAPMEDGAVHWDEAEYFLPLPVNSQQFEVIRRVDHQALTLVQGPPGTGKTHTTAALISHLLAQGKRVLVTAQTDQALHEVRDKLPDDIRDLAVTVLGTSQSDRALLTRSVTVLADRANSHSTSNVEQEVAKLRMELAAASVRRAGLRTKLLELREADVQSNSVGSYQGTCAQITEQVHEGRSAFGWAEDLIPATAPNGSPLEAGEWMELLALLRRSDFDENSTELSYAVPDAASLPTPSALSGLLQKVAAAEQEIGEYSRVADNPVTAALRLIEPTRLLSLGRAVNALSSTKSVWSNRSGGWLSIALADLLLDKEAMWVSRRDVVSTRLTSTHQHLAELGDEHQVTVATGKARDYKIMNGVVRDFLSAGSTIKTDPLGRPKLGLLTSRTLKACAPLFENVLVENRPPVTKSALARIAAMADLEDDLAVLDAAWPITVVPPEDTFIERVAWHQGELTLLNEVLNFGNDVSGLRSTLAQLNVPPIDWSNDVSIQDLGASVALVQAEQVLSRVQAPVQEAISLLESLESAGFSSPLARSAVGQIRTRDIDGYAQIFSASQQLTAMRLSRDIRDRLLALVHTHAPRLASELLQDPQNQLWTDRISIVCEAWAWRAVVTWINEMKPENLERIQESIRNDEDRMRTLVGKVAAQLAWSKSVGKLKQSQISDLIQYTQLVKKLGKGTGKYAAMQTGQIREVLARCTDSVPVWIVPLHRVATQFAIQPGLFDVVIIDEASQAGLEATFLQFLGKRMVVVGDDKQVSPTVIINHANVHALAQRYLDGSPYAATWSDPERSLFDEARAKYRDLITLVEHRRCVSDIIGFSNEIAYEPDGIRLIPVRETGSSALEPIVPVFVADGYAEGLTSSNRRNPREAQEIVGAMKAAIADPRYAGMTMGVISLLGESQARLIESMLLEEIGPVELAKRQIRCGIAPAFQGSERNVIFLSMVAASDDDQRFAAQTRETAIQRYNVAVSRAQDQLWVFHSEPLSRLNNPDDLRRRLLEYAYRVKERRGAGTPGASRELAPEHVLVSPFDSLFEQRVHNRIFERGYAVVPQYESLGYRIDLVVVGKRGKFAIECDGDHWHGPDQYLADIGRQRELERCGWKFFRLRQSDFVVDSYASLQDLWPKLDALNEDASLEAQSGQAHSFEVQAQVDSRSDIRVPAEKDDDFVEGSWIEPDNLETSTLDPLISSFEELMEEPVSLERELTILLDKDGEDPQDQLKTGLGTLADSAAHGASDLNLSDSGSGEALVGGVREAWQATYALWHSEGMLPDIASVDLRELAASLVEIVAAEGPVLGARAMRLYVRASGGSRLGKNIVEKFEKAIGKAQSAGLLVASNPTRTKNVGQMTFRSPNQHLVMLRSRGPRTLYEIPHDELREVMARIASERGFESDEIFRGTLLAYDLVQLNEKSSDHLKRVAKLTPPDPAQVA